MEIILCIPVVAVIISFVAWMFIRESNPFSHFPMTEYRLLLESIAFFIPAGITGWYSAILAQVILESDGKRLSILWLIGMLVVFIIMGFLELAIGVKQAPKDMGNHDLIAVGLGYLAGLLFGGYQVMVRHNQPPQYLYLFWKESDRIFLFFCIGSIAFFGLLAILQQNIRRHRKKATHRRKKVLAPHEMEPENGVLNISKNQADGEENPSIKE